MRDVDDAEKQGGLCEGEGKRVGRHFCECESNSWLAQVIICAVEKGSPTCPEGRVGSHRAFWGPVEWGCPGHSRLLFFSACCSPLCSCTSPGLLWIGLTRPSSLTPPPSPSSFASVALLC